ncbi:MAG: hypothetical protein PHI22_04495 [Bacilli bacterium]|nr:hypothetical protein [Bacilli bacterium]
MQIKDRSIRELEIENVSKCLNNIGINMVDEKGSFRPFNEVMIDLGEKLRRMRYVMKKKEFELTKSYILNTICGVRYRNEFM